MAGHSAGSPLIPVLYMRQGWQFSLILLSCVPSLNPPFILYTCIYTKILSASELYLLPFNILSFMVLKFDIRFSCPENNCVTFVTQGKTVLFTILIWCTLHMNWTSRYFLVQTLHQQWELSASYLSTDCSGSTGRRLSDLQCLLCYHSPYHSQKLLKSHIVFPGAFVQFFRGIKAWRQDECLKLCGEYSDIATIF